jgi:hypothetical protein
MHGATVKIVEKNEIVNVYCAVETWTLKAFK